VPFDISVSSTDGSENMKKYQEYINTNFNVTGEHIFNIYQSDSVVFSDLRTPFFGMNIVSGFMDESHDMLITYTDYISLREMLGYTPATMDDNEFMIHCLSFFYPNYNSYTAKNPMTDINGHRLNFAGIYAENFDQYDGFPNGWKYILVVPDFVVNDAEYSFTKYAATTERPVSLSQYEAMLNEFGTLNCLRFNTGTQQDTQINDFLDAWVNIQKHNGISVVTGLLPMWYIAFILFITGATVLVSNILSEDANYKRQFKLLRNLGYSNRGLDKIIIIQLANFFIVPIIPAIILTFVLSPLFASSQGYYGFVPNLDLWYGIISACIVFLAIYLIYYAAAYVLLRKSVLENKK
jgi:ABC-type antimicrobial peptide transport system permease subunit